MKLTQCDKILIAMLRNQGKDNWKATDFMTTGKYFVGYEASARMSDLIRLYPELFIIGKEDRFRTLSINLERNNLIKDLLKKYDLV